MPSASATAAPRPMVRAATMRVDGSWPRCWISSVNESVPSRSRSIGGRETNVPRPRVRSRRCSRARSLEGAADGDQAAAVAIGELALRGELVARPPLAGVERGAQVEIDLVVERDRAREEPEACHGGRGRPSCGGACLLLRL